VKITNLFPREIVFTAAKRFSCINLPANSLRRNYETSLISADPLCFDLRPVMAAIISCDSYDVSSRSTPWKIHLGDTTGEPWSAVIYIARYIKENVSFKVARRGNIDQRYIELWHLGL